MVERYPYASCIDENKNSYESSKAEQALKDSGQQDKTYLVLENHNITLNLKSS